MATDAMLVADDEARSVDANPQAEALTGYSREEPLRLRVMEPTPHTVPQQGQDLYQEFVNQRRMTGEYTLRRKDGTLVPVEHAAVRNGAGRSLSILRGVTARKAADADRERLLVRERVALAVPRLPVRSGHPDLMGTQHGAHPTRIWPSEAQSRDLRPTCSPRARGGT